jgi:hypothetical protein
VKKIILFLLGIILLAAGGVFLYRHLDREDTGDCVNEFEDRDYVDAINCCNRLIPESEYEEAGKLHYYRVRAHNRLAEKMNERFEDELTELNRVESRTPEGEKLRDKITSRLEKVNEKTGGNLQLIMGKNSSWIETGGEFYDTFASKYRGSPFLEDLDFEELEKVRRRHPERLPGAIIRFHERYPDSSYLPHLVRFSLDLMQKGLKTDQEFQQALKAMISSFAHRFPTSAEMSRIYRATEGGVNIRTSPGLEGNITGKTDEGEILIQLEKSVDTMQVGDMRDYWYRVASADGVRGWIYGAFLEPFRAEASDRGEAWIHQEQFRQWSDSHTPGGWIHLEGSDPEGVTFAGSDQGRRLTVDSPTGIRTGLFRSFTTTPAFTAECRTRHLEGGEVTALLYRLPDGRAFNLTLSRGKVSVCERQVSLDTRTWHTFRITSRDGRHADLYVDGEKISGRIEACKPDGFEKRGIYIMGVSKVHRTRAEMMYVLYR